MFYIMAMVEGRVIWDNAMPGGRPAERRAIFEAEISTLARLHQLDPDGIGLGDYGRPGNYFARQVERWTRQYRAAEIDPIPEMDRLIDWLPPTTPPQERTSVVHGDYRMDNMIFAADQPRVAAVLDWELSTLGDPLADFSYLAMNWNMPADGRSGLAGLDLKALGIPTLDEAVELYCRLTNRSGVPDLNWYFAFGLFRLASITQGIAKRVQVGTAASERARETGARTPRLAAAAWSFALKAGA
jgi:aminoglycoside phosphotransferase (APT) family kinase protein